MTILLVLIPLGFILLCIALAAFIWAVRDGQFEDLEGEGARILFEDEPVPSPLPQANAKATRKAEESSEEVQP
ncbi:MAG: cbb3-type cytochrome oxidase assembly protein CcoS [Myxococcota bacterium]